MEIPLAYRIAAPVVLLVFTITSCNAFHMPVFTAEEEEITIHNVPYDKGIPLIAYLDKDNKPTTSDIGKMAVVVDGNEYAEGVMVIAEIRDNHIDNDIVVRVINSNNNSFASFFYSSGSNFPNRIVMTFEGNDVIAHFSPYNSRQQTYSVMFIDEDSGESENIENLVLNKNVFTLHENHQDLTSTQNARLSSIKTSLALWTSMALQIEDLGGDDSSPYARGLWNNIRKVARWVLPVVAIVAFAVVIIAAPAGAVAIAGASIKISIVTSTQAAAAAIGFSAVLLATINLLPIPEETSGNGGNHGSPPANFTPRPKLAITMNGGKQIKNNQTPEFYLNEGESLSFNINFDFIPQGFTHNGIINPLDFILPFSPYDETVIGWDRQNADFFNYKLDKYGADGIRFTITRKRLAGSHGPGTVQLVMVTLKEVIFNDNPDGILFRFSPGDQRAKRNDIFVLNFTVVK